VVTHLQQGDRDKVCDTSKIHVVANFCTSLRKNAVCARVDTKHPKKHSRWDERRQENQKLPHGTFRRVMNHIATITPPPPPPAYALEFGIIFCDQMMAAETQKSKIHCYSHHNHDAMMATTTTIWLLINNRMMTNKIKQ
jgi:hypothetical protein